MDLLVNLYSPEFIEALAMLDESNNVKIVRMLSCRKQQLLDYICEHFSQNWASEVESGFGMPNPTVFVAIQAGEIVGFVAYNVTAHGFFGPLGVSKSARGQGIGQALTVRALQVLKQDGYPYGIIGGAEEAAEFYHQFLPIEPIVSSHEHSIYDRQI
ncbi:GNAT family N-acetyltransferase [Dolosigranulum savutiense]|uniref:GNAT family N-acetyltransferase n=1 Tax=Dolosigranulum savutiense TaxID=3110288 RepID=A0AB74U4C7_9LACT